MLAEKAGLFADRRSGGRDSRAAGSGVTAAPCAPKEPGLDRVDPGG